FKSEKLLLTTNKSIQEISTECGFSDTKYYYKHFNKWYNCTPAQYRKKYKPEVDKETIKKEIALDELLKLLTIPHLMTNQGACVF
ncbi:helix-turn-helix domain-containing protein, partial [Alkalihalophilus lindianensis]